MDVINDIVVTGDLKKNIVCPSLRNKTFKILQLLEQQSKSEEYNYLNIPEYTKREITLENYSSINTHIKRSKENHLSSERAVIAFGILFIVFMVYLIYRFRECKKQDSLASYNRRGSSFTNSNNSTGSDSFDHYNPSPRAPTIFDNLNMEVSQNAGYLTTQLDLPPTYAASTHNSTENLHKNNLNVANCSDYSLPPSYDEAISHKANQNNDTDIHSRDHHREEYGHEQHDEADGSSSRRNMDRVVVTVKQNL